MSDDTDTAVKTQVPQLHLDYESRSRVDLLKYGAYNYAQSPSTELHCFSWAFDDEPPQNWHPPMPLPERVLAHFKACQAAKGDPLHPYARSIHAHNAAFERLMTWFVLCVDYPEVPEPPLETFYCTAAQARARALPGGLDNLGTALQLRTRKDKRGKELIKLLCVPDAYGNFNEDPELLQELYDYCDTDVVVERDAEKMTPPLTEDEWLDYLVSERINDYGIRVDVEFCCAAQRYAEPEKDAINAEISEMTDGAVKSARSFPSLKTWIAPFRETNEIIRKATTKVKTDRRTKEETRKITLDKGARHNILSAEEESPGSIPAVVAGLVSLLDEAGRTSISKYASMARRANDDERVCGAYVYCGAGQTHRFSSTGLQVHNYTRDCSKEPEIVRAEVLDGGLNLTASNPDWSILDILASMLRPTIIAAPGRRLVWGDWSAVEARVTPWLANSTGANVILGLFRSGQDIYVHEAAKIYNTTPENIDPEGDQRQIGKVACIAEGELVLTENGLMPIEKVSSSVRVWDGLAWVSHSGPVCQGIRDVITYEGLTATEDHLVWTQDGRTLPFGTCAGKQIALAQTGSGRQAVRFRENSLGKSTLARWLPVFTRALHRLLRDETYQHGESTEGTHGRVPSLCAAAPRPAAAIETTGDGKAPLRKPPLSVLETLRWAWNRVPVSFRIGRRFVGVSKPGYSASTCGAGPSRQRRALRSWKSALGFAVAAVTQYAQIKTTGRLGIPAGGMALCTEYGAAQTARGAHPTTNLTAGPRSRTREAQGMAPYRRTTRVYDLVNCGPRHRFTVSGRLVHNCLSLGFGGGMGALLAMARNYGVKLTPETAARVVAAWREANPWARDYWSASIKAAKQAVRYPGEYFQAGRINYVCVNDAHHPVLYAVLPDATILAYPKIALENIETKFGPSQELTYLKASWKPKADEPGWPRAQLWHGTLVENAVQGTAAALLRRALRRLYAWDWDCIAGHTHDDIMLEPFADEVDDAKAALVEAMMFSEPWQEGLPLAVDVKDGERLRK